MLRIGACVFAVALTLGAPSVEASGLSAYDEYVSCVMGHAVVALHHNVEDVEAAAFEPCQKLGAKLSSDDREGAYEFYSAAINAIWDAVPKEPKSTK